MSEDPGEGLDGRVGPVDCREAGAVRARGRGWPGAAGCGLTGGLDARSLRLGGLGLPLVSPGGVQGAGRGRRRNGRAGTRP